MKVPTASTSTLPTHSNRTSIYHHRKRSPPGSSESNCSSTKRNSSVAPLLREQTPPAGISVEMKRELGVPLTTADREMANLLELEYRQDVKAYMYQMETKTLASVELIDQQPELAWYMRPYLVDFLIEIHQRHRLRPETLYLALNIVDRYVSKRIVFKKHYQLVGCAALWIAAKFEDAKDRVPTVPELCQLCSHAYDESAFIQMEGHVLSTINWVMGHPTTEAWLRLACVTGPNGIEEPRTQHVARFLMEISLFHKEFIPFKPSEIALASLLLARFMLGKSRRVSDETENVLFIANLLDAHFGESLEKISTIVIKKYSFPFYSRASTFVSEWFLSGRRFSLYDWSSRDSSNTLPSTPNGSNFHSTPISSASSSSTDPSSSASRSSRSTQCTTSPSSCSSAASSDQDDDDDEEECEPLTPLTPLPNFPTEADPSAYSLPKPPQPQQSTTVHYRRSILGSIGSKENSFVNRPTGRLAKILNAETKKPQPPQPGANSDHRMMEINY